MADDDQQQDEDFLPPSAEQGDELEIVNAADQQSLKRQRRRQMTDAEKIRDWWRAVMATEIGRLVVWQLLQDAHTFEDRFACGPNGFPQPEATWFQAGEKAFGQRLHQTISIHARDGLFLMHDEHDPRYPKPKRQRNKRQPGE